jgi:uncharacterized membrane protein YoaK (UPF0700 family)
MLKSILPTFRAVFWRDERHGPLPLLLLCLTIVTGLIDAVSYLKLGHVFVANMTGNVVFMGFAVAGTAEFSIAAAIVAIAAFLFGALAGGRLGAACAHHRGKYLAISTNINIALVCGALVVSILSEDAASELVRYALIVLLAIAMGLQNATARRLGVPDLTTTVLTLTLTGFAADSTLAGGKSPNRGRRFIATIAMFAGAAVGAFLIFNFGVSAVLALALTILAIIGLVLWRLSQSIEAWTVGT